MTETKAVSKPRKCRATIGPDDDDPTIYLCNRRVPHTTLHSETQSGEVVAVWCTCKDCKKPNPDLCEETDEQADEGEGDEDHQGG